MLQIDGSKGEGGGQILRSALSLSLITGRPFQMIEIRAHRSRAGLMPQHLQALHAAAVVTQASVAGDQQESNTIYFKPQKLKGDTYDFNIGTAGSAPLAHTSRISDHLITNSEIVQLFLPAEISIHGKPGEPRVVEITGCGGAEA